ncbi:MAG: protein phosphatase 2C domain-containing protein [Methanobrevibacter sp.]|nr:protein phosphatase 2C domain-containing protein [Methanobrevibacter sp.]
MINQDRILVDEMLLSGGKVHGKTKNPLCVIICDGAGGETRGEWGSEMTASSFLEINPIGKGPLSLYQHLSIINEKLLKISKELFPVNDHIVATIAGIMVCGNQILLFNTGDTRIYSIVNGELTQLSVDHSEMDDHNHRLLTKSIGGGAETWIPSIKFGAIMNNQGLLLVCSDGLYEIIENNHLFENEVSIEFEDIVRKLSEIQDQGTADDASFCILKFNR